MEIVIATALDNGYTMPTVVMLQSMFENAGQETRYDVYLLVPAGFEKENKERFEQLNHSFPKHGIAFVDMGSAFAQEKMLISHISYPTYYRLLLPEILSDKKRCLYLDGDMLVMQDLSPLFWEDLQGAYIGGVKAPFYQSDDIERERVCKRLGIPDAGSYINAGVLLMDLEKMREDDMVQSFMKLLQLKHWSSQDQDILNAACYGKIRTLPFCYNYQVVGAFYPQDILERIYPQGERMKPTDAPVIIHYSNKSVKPWKSLQYLYADIWWEYFCRSSYSKEEVARKEEIVKEEEKKRLEFQQHKECLQNASAVILFGYSDTGIELMRYLQQDGICVSCFCDNDEKKQGMREQGKHVLPLSRCLEEYPEAYYVNTSQAYRKDITEQLLQAGVLRMHIVEYQKKERYLERVRKPEYRERYGDIYL